MNNTDAFSEVIQKLRKFHHHDIAKAILEVDAVMVMFSDKDGPLDDNAKELAAALKRLAEEWVRML